MPKKNDKSNEVEDVSKEPEETAVQVETSAELEAAKSELDTLKDQHLRLRAEYDNFRKRTQKERESLYVEVKSETVKTLLQVVDNLERAVAIPTEDTAYAQGVEMTLRGCLEAFSKLGVTVIDALDKPFNPELHEAVAHGTDDTKPENTVVDVLQKGYCIGEKVIRHAIVRVVN